MWNNPLEHSDRSMGWQDGVVLRWEKGIIGGGETWTCKKNAMDKKTQKNTANFAEMEKHKKKEENRVCPPCCHVIMELIPESGAEGPAHKPHQQCRGHHGRRGAQLCARGERSGEPLEGGAGRGRGRQQEAGVVMRAGSAFGAGAGGGAGIRLGHDK